MCVNVLIMKTFGIYMPNNYYFIKIIVNWESNVYFSNFLFVLLYHDNKNLIFLS